MGNALDSGFWEGLGLGVGGGAPNTESGFGEENEGEGWLVYEGLWREWGGGDMKFSFAIRFFYQNHNS